MIASGVADRPRHRPVAERVPSVAGDDPGVGVGVVGAHHDCAVGGELDELSGSHLDHVVVGAAAGCVRHPGSAET
jgi:hypothetical protein